MSFTFSSLDGCSIEVEHKGLSLLELVKRIKVDSTPVFIDDVDDEFNEDDDLEEIFYHYNQPVLTNSKR